MGNIGFSVRFEEDVAAVLEKYPKLSTVVKNGNVILKGEIDLIDEFGENRDTYSIEIHPVLEYPQRFPHVFETGGRLPQNVDWHVYESDGRCCIKVLPEEILICKAGITLLSFIDQQVLPYLFNQTFRRINGYFINERKHGLIGIIEFYQDALKEQNIVKLIELLEFILNNEEPNRVSMCFCGKRTKYRNCHRSSLKLIINIGLLEVQLHINLIKEAIKQVSDATKKEIE